MGWLQTKQKENVQRELFPDLNNEEQCIVNLLQKHTEGLQINTLVVQADLPISQLSTLLFELEMKGVVKAMAGGVYKIID
jgi:DNA processing protein